MGILLSRFRKEKSTIEILDKLENDIKEIEENRMNAQRKYKKITKLLLVFSLGLFIVCSTIFYFQYTTTLNGKLLYLVPLAISPLILYIVKKIISWYYVRLINKNQIRLNEMKKEKKRILEEVMDKETYKVAKKILDKFSAPETSLKANSNTQLMPIPKSDDGLRKRLVRGTSSFTSTSVQPTSNTTKGFAKNQTPWPSLSSSAPLKSLPAPVTPMMWLPAPILPLQRSYVDRVVEYLIGDGVNNRYALICSQCHSHNGMALKEEFEYISYKCCYCFFYNPARKVRPEAPKLEGSLRLRRVSDSDSEKTSGESSDAEHKIKSGGTLVAMEISNIKNDVDLINLKSDSEKVTDEAFENVLRAEAEKETNLEIIQPSIKEETSLNQPESSVDRDHSLVKS